MTGKRGLLVEGLPVLCGRCDGYLVEPGTSAEPCRRCHGAGLLDLDEYERECSFCHESDPGRLEETPGGFVCDAASCRREFAESARDAALGL